VDVGYVWNDSVDQDQAETLFMIETIGLYLLLTSMIASFIMMFVAEYRRGSLFILYALGLLLLIMLPIAYDFSVVIADPYAPQFSMMMRVVVFITLFNALYCLFRDVTAVVVFPRAIKPFQWDNPLNEALTNKVLWGLLPLIFLINMAAYDFSIDNMMSSSWLDANADDGKVANTLKDLLLTIAPGAITYFIMQKKKRAALLYGFVLLLLIIMDRTRGALVGLFSNIAFLMLVHYRNSAHKRRLILWYLLIGFSAVFLFVGIQIVRYAGAFSNLIQFIKPETVLPLLQKRLMSRDSEIHIIDYFYYIIGYQSYVVGQETYSNLMRTIFMLDLTHLLKGVEDMPKELWETYKVTDLKPRQGSLHPTIYGIAWMDGNWGGLIYAPFVATLYSVLEWFIYRLERLHPCWYFVLGSIGYLAAFTARGSAYIAAWTCFAGILLAWMILFFLNKVCKNPPTLLPSYEKG
jgi:hypothetical protein